jgi:DNA helicase II / ATP-dependent DNA helicase PcrA
MSQNKVANLQFNWNPKKVELILGPPGTGKTTRLMALLDDALRTYDARRICFVAFTKKAAAEATTRAAELFQLTQDDLLHFRTLHSFAFRMMGMSSKQIMGVGDYINIAKSLGLFISYRGMKEDGSFHGQTKGDRLLFLAGLARLQNKTIPEVHADWIDENLSIYEIQLMHETIEAYKHETGKKDFTDVIQDYIASGFVPDLDVLFVDESQDLSPLQWTMVSKLAENASEVFIAGDDDQAIFRWAGADVQQFLGLPIGRTTVLDQSYRVPSKIATCANRIISTVSNRFHKKWKPRMEQGTARFIGSPDTLDMGNGSWLLLARNSYLLEEFTTLCMQRGYVFESAQGAPVAQSLLTTIRFWERLRKGKYLTIDQVLLIYEYMSTKIGVAYGMKSVIKQADPEQLVCLKDLQQHYGLLTTAVWYEALDRIPPNEKEYLLVALRRGEQIEGGARIKISTIHGVKGGEADNVVMFMDMARRTYQEYQANPDDEARVWYVGVTRARQNLYIVYPRTPNHYPLDIILRKP